MIWVISRVTSEAATRRRPTSSELHCQWCLHAYWAAYIPTTVKYRHGRVCHKYDGDIHHSTHTYVMVYTYIQPGTYIMYHQWHINTFAFNKLPVTVWPWPWPFTQRSHDVCVNASVYDTFTQRWSLCELDVLHESCSTESSKKVNLSPSPNLGYPVTIASEWHIQSSSRAPVPCRRPDGEIFCQTLSCNLIRAPPVVGQRLSGNGWLAGPVSVITVVWSGPGVMNSIVACGGVTPAPGDH
jgi:hypothetical protein